MEAFCPSCRSPLDLNDQNFGTLFTCVSCRAVFFVGWDGLPEVSSEQDTRQELTVESESSELPEEKLESFPAEEIVEVENSSSAEVPNSKTQDQGHSIPRVLDFIVEGVVLPRDLEEVRSVFADPRLGLRTEIVELKSVQSEVHIKGLTPLKAAVLAQRLFLAGYKSRVIKAKSEESETEL